MKYFFFASLWNKFSKRISDYLILTRLLNEYFTQFNSQRTFQMPLIVSLEQRLIALYQKQSTELINRRRQDVKDQMEDLAPASENHPIKGERYSKDILSYFFFSQRTFLDSGKTKTMFEELLNAKVDVFVAWSLDLWLLPLPMLTVCRATMRSPKWQPHLIVIKKVSFTQSFERRIRIQKSV